MGIGSAFRKASNAASDVARKVVAAIALDVNTAKAYAVQRARMVKNAATTAGHEVKDAAIGVKDAFVSTAKKIGGTDTASSNIAHEVSGPAVNDAYTQVHANFGGQPVGQSIQPCPQEPREQSGCRMSERGLERIRAHESFRATTYLDQAGNPTIGYGHLIKRGESFPNAITQVEAAEIFNADVSSIVNPSLDQITVRLNQNQVDAIGSFIFNAGPGAFGSDVLPLLNSGDFSGATEMMGRYTNITVEGQKRHSRGLENRRREEIELFNTPPASQCISGHCVAPDEE